MKIEKALGFIWLLKKFIILVSSSLMVDAEDRSTSERLHVVSWNVAGWRTCVREMTKSFRSTKPSEAVSSWLGRLECDILCIQETKVRRRQVVEDGQALCAWLEGYESYWSCNEGTGGQRAGLNGVATLSRVAVAEADPRPLRDAALDAEGRALLTDHGSFYILNIYVPCSRPEIKKRFLDACSACVDRLSKPVVVCGDLNCTRRPVDTHWTFGEVEAASLPRWSEVRSKLERRAARAVETKNAKTGETFTKHRCVVDQKWIGGFHLSAEGALAALDPDALGVADCIDVYKKLCGVDLDRTRLEGLTRKHTTQTPLFENLVDAFAELYPNAADRFTCWDQYTNKRYDNVGSRVDYILVDRSLFVDPVRDPLLGDESSRALCDATNHGAFRPAPFEGSGLPDASPAASVAHADRAPATTILYTPPSWSDHVAVALCVARPPQLLHVLPSHRAGCRSAQPHAAVQTITRFFKPLSPDAHGSTHHRPLGPPPAKKRQGALFRYFPPRPPDPAA